MSSYIDWGEEVDRYYKYHSTKKNPWSSLLSQISDSISRQNYQTGLQNKQLAQFALQQSQQGVSQLYSQYLSGRKALSGSNYSDAFKSGALRSLDADNLSSSLGQTYRQSLQQAQEGLQPGMSLEDHPLYRDVYVPERDKAKQIFTNFFSYFAPKGSDSDSTLAYLEQEGYMRNGALTSKGLLYFKSYFAHSDIRNEDDIFFEEQGETLGEYLRHNVEDYHDQYIEEILGDMLGVDFTTGEFNDKERKKLFGDEVVGLDYKNVKAMSEVEFGDLRGLDHFIQHNIKRMDFGKASDIEREYVDLYTQKQVGLITEAEFQEKLQAAGIKEGMSVKGFPLSFEQYNEQIDNAIQVQSKSWRIATSEIFDATIQTKDGPGYVLSADETERLLTGGHRINRKGEEKETSDRRNLAKTIWKDEDEESRGKFYINDFEVSELRRLGALRDGDTFQKDGISFIIYNGEQRILLDKETLKTIGDKVDRSYLYQELGSLYHATGERRNFANYISKQLFA